MGDPANNKDNRAMGGNPCLEQVDLNAACLRSFLPLPSPLQTLESYELCCLVETFPNNHETFEDYKQTLKVGLFPLPLPVPS